MSSRREDYSFELPKDQIAQCPPETRGGSRLMILDRATKSQTVATFAELADFLPAGALLVANNSMVLPARLMGRRPTGGKAEFLLLTPLPLLLETAVAVNENLEAEAEGLLKASKGFKAGQSVAFSDDLSLEVLEMQAFGRARVRLRWVGDLAALFANLGDMPLPPYISRPTDEADATRYQTTYADPCRQGSAAAPTAGLHFTPELRESLAARGFGWAEVTLYVGYGTFSPVRVDDIREHTMHGEYFQIPEATARAVREAKMEGRPVVAVGTTSVRALEAMYELTGDIKACSGWTEIFISPGYTFKVVDAILTNFHLPESSLIIMISAFAGREFVLQSYARAVAEGFRFFSYGDAMLIR